MTVTDEYRLEAAPHAPGLLTPVNNKTGRSILGVHDGTPVIVGTKEARIVLDALNNTSTGTDKALVLDAAAVRVLRDAAAAARGMAEPTPPDCAEWADWLDARAAALVGGHLDVLTEATSHGGHMRVEWRIGNPDGPSYAIPPEHPEAEKWTRRVADPREGSWVERRTVTTYPPIVTEWERA